MSVPAATLAGPLSDTQIERYSRQIILPEMGANRQRHLLATSVALIGTPAITSHAAIYLAAAGVGRLGFVNATVLTPPGDLRALRELNPDTRVEPLDLAEWLAAELEPFAVVIDTGVDAAVREQVNDRAVARHVPLVLGVTHGAEGHLTTLAGHRADAPCSACLGDWSAPIDTDGAELSEVAAALVGTLLATEALKCILDIGTPLYGRLLTCDARAFAFETRPLAKRPACRICGMDRSSSAG